MRQTGCQALQFNAGREVSRPRSVQKWREFGRDFF
jgi:hypothetical protein